MEESPKSPEDGQTPIPQEAPTPEPAVVDVYERLRQMRGKGRFSRTWEELKEDR
jgi:hypothetical protein